MDLMDLGLEYLERAVHLRRRAKEITAMKPYDETQCREYKRRASALCTDASECARIGRLLISYYRKGWKDEPHQF